MQNFKQAVFSSVIILSTAMIDTAMINTAIAVPQFYSTKTTDNKQIGTDLADGLPREDTDGWTFFDYYVKDDRGNVVKRLGGTKDCNFTLTPLPGWFVIVNKNQVLRIDADTPLTIHFLATICASRK